MGISLNYKDPFLTNYETGLRELEYGEPISVTVQALQEQKYHNGLSPIWPFQDAADSFPTVAERYNHRRRYAVASIAASGTPSISPYSYSASMGISGAGNTGTVTGMKAAPYTGADATPNSTWNIWATIITFTNLDGSYVSASYQSWDGTGGFLTIDTADNASATYSNATHDLSISLSSEVDFTDALTIAVNRVVARSFPTFSAGVSTEVFSEWDQTGSEDPDDYDMSPVSSGVGAFANPYFGPRVTGHAALWSGWYFDSQEESQAAPIGFTTEKLKARRARFKLTGGGPSTLVPYFIAGATLCRVPTAGPAASNDDLTNVWVVSKGWGQPDQIIEIPFPDSDDLPDVAGIDGFAEIVLPDRGFDSLSYGAICFCIVGETPEQWEARTGFVVDGTVA